MANFAKVRDGIVVRVIKAEPEFFDTFIDDSPGEWIQTSFNTRGGVHYITDTNIPSEDQSKALRKNAAAIGMSYNRELDAFIPPKIFASWVLNKDTCLWEPPTPQPEGNYGWDEETKSWKENFPHD